MIRFIDLGRQYWLDQEDKDNEKSFAFINTVTDRFIEAGGNQFWDTKEDFIEDLQVSTLQLTKEEEERFSRLIPKDWWEKKK